MIHSVIGSGAREMDYHNILAFLYKGLCVLIEGFSIVTSIIKPELNSGKTHKV